MVPMLELLKERFARCAHMRQAGDLYELDFCEKDCSWVPSSAVDCAALRAANGGNGRLSHHHRRAEERPNCGAWHRATLVAGSTMTQLADALVPGSGDRRDTGLGV